MADTCRILLIENAAYLVNFLSKVLERKFEIANAKTIPEASQILKEKPFDIVLLDNHTAEPGFYNPLQSLMAEYPGLPVVIMATRRDQSNAEQALKKNPRLFFADKPAQQNQLIYTCKKAATLAEEMKRKMGGKTPSSGDAAPTSKDLDSLLSNDSLPSKDSKPVKAPAGLMGDLPRSVIVIEDDEFIIKMIAAALKDFGIKTVDSFNDGEKGWAAAVANNYDFVILDWMVPSVPGLALFNRFRHHDLYRLTPILVISGFIGKKDFSILGDFHLSEIYEKPFQSASLIKKVTQLHKEAVWYNSQEEKLFDFFDKVKSKKIEDPQIIIKFISQSPKPYPLALIAGRILKYNENYEAAEALFKYALKGKDSSLMALNDLGKLYLLTGRNKEAKNALKKAMDISPDNIERLCDLGNISLKEMDTKSANQYFNKALKIDKKDQRAIGGTKLVRNINDWMATTDAVPETYAGLLNAIGISLVRGGQFQQGIEHYKSALMHIEDDDSKSKLSFNLGLGYTKWSALDKALPWFQKALELNPTYDKALKYVEKLGSKASDATDFSAPLVAPDFEDGLEGDFMMMEDVDKESLNLEDDESSENAGGKEFSPQYAKVKEEDSQGFKRDLRKFCPRIDEFFEMLVNDGVYVSGQLNLLQKLLAQYGEGAFTQAINAALDANITSVLEISNILATRNRPPSE